MSRFSRRERRTMVAPYIKIQGKRVDLYTAKIVYKCSVCFGDLIIKDAGLKCKANQEHRRFVHRDEMVELQKQQSKNIDDLKDVYKIVDGKVIVR